jgi:hypothetical protein
LPHHRLRAEHHRTIRHHEVMKRRVMLRGNTQRTRQRPALVYFPAQN